MKLHIVAVGKPPAGPVRDAIGEYERRAGRYWPLVVNEVRAEPARSRQPAEVRRLEGERLLARSEGVLVALDERGRAMPTDLFARWLSDRRDGAEDVSFMIGGALGLDVAVRDSARLVLSLSAWTLPHDLARLLLAEQLYRAGTILRGEPYHKAG